MVVATSSFTKQAEKLAESNNVELIDGNKLNELVKEHWWANDGQMWILSEL